MGGVFSCLVDCLGITANEKVFAKNGQLKTKSGKENRLEQNAFSDF
jgi:hypothetical protein